MRPRLSPRQTRDLWQALAPRYREEAEAHSRAGTTTGQLPSGARAETGRIRDRIGALAGLSGRSVEKCNAVYEAAAREPALFAPVVAYLERSGNIDDAHRRMIRIGDLAAVSHLAPAAGRYATLVLDPPWQDESVSENQRPPYATMTPAAIAAVPVPDWAFARAHLYCHAPGPFVPLAVALAQGWGFAFKTLIAWHKPRFSQGRYFRTQDEFVVFATRGGLMTARQDLPNHIAAPSGGHSEKPEAFYDLVRAASPPPYGEAFARRVRPDFAPLYRPSPTLPEAAE